ncbi:hypothetical protein FH609_024930 [Streptomyces sp. 3MP-14]|uniref:Uncharacterized protein n=1 Tax=Streptomyces mimosae TaxID=2586635 RepID=A0A5N6A2L1_9ACTN|nr:MULTISPECIES: hypothetical protein [Streptomyces]KAB8162136.1 hypothetical protein FH607_021805 [Streptomyces mimosae]KAB8173966.1 hypothetical protein FH609_024930 [Streptomyces sp. 3MP-14]
MGGEWEFALPLPGRWGANSWVVGPCWFFCGHQVTAVVWIGAVSTVGAHAPLYACGTCLDQLHAMVWDFAESGWKARYRRARTVFGRRLRRSADAYQPTETKGSGGG